MTTDAADSGGHALDRVPFSLQLGLGLAGIVFAVATLADIIEYQIPAVVWFAASAGLLARAARLRRQS